MIGNAWEEPLRSERICAWIRAQLGLKALELGFCERRRLGGLANCFGSRMNAARCFEMHEPADMHKERWYARHNVILIHKTDESRAQATFEISGELRFHADPRLAVGVYPPL